MHGIKCRAPLDELHIICKQYRDEGIGGGEITDVILNYLKEYNVNEDYENELKMLMDRLIGWCSLSVSLSGVGFINIYLDDERRTPNKFVRTYTPKQTIELLSQHSNVGILSLDHDLGDDEGIGTGYDVLKWIEEMVYLDPLYQPPKEVLVHSANPPAAKKMMAAIENIKKLILLKE